MKKLQLILLLICIGCSDLKEYKIQFDNVSGLDKRTPVFIKGLEVGRVKKTELNSDKTLATIQIEGYIKVSKDSKFILRPELMGGKSIEIVLGDNVELIDQDQILTGQLAPLDSTLVREISEHELDSLAKVDPEYKIADTVVKILKKVKGTRDKKN